MKTVRQIHFDNGGFNQYLTPCRTQHPVQEVTHFGMLILRGTHADDAGFGVAKLRNHHVGRGADEEADAASQLVVPKPAELADAVKRFEAQGAAGIVIDVSNGEVLASASLPAVDPSQPNMSLEAANLDKVSGSTFELGSVFKTMTIAMALDAALATPETIVDVRKELTAGRFTIKDLHPLRRPLSVAEIFLHSSNVGSAMLATQAGTQHFRDFLRRMQLLEPMRTEAGPVAPPQLPQRWGDVETMTIAYGHGIALADRLDGRRRRIFCLLGDGEMQEGQVWEAAMTAAQHKLDNLCAIVDYNGVQQNGPVAQIKNEEPLAGKLRDFGWNTLDINGHDFDDIIKALDRSGKIKDKPTFIAARTIKGKGVSFMEGNPRWHGKAPNGDELSKALEEIKEKI